MKRYVDRSRERTWHIQKTLISKTPTQISLEDFRKEEEVGFEVQVRLSCIQGKKKKKDMSLKKEFCARKL